MTDSAPPKQLHLPLDRPVLPVVEAQLCGTDIEITDALTPLVHYANAAYLYRTLLALAKLATKKTPGGNRPCLRAQMGYAQLSKYIQANYGATLDKWALQKAAKTLKEFCYMEEKIQAHSGTEATTYTPLSPQEVMAMLAQAGCTHYRVLRGGRVQLLRPRQPLQPEEVPS